MSLLRILNRNARSVIVKRDINGYFDITAGIEDKVYGEKQGLGWKLICDCIVFMDLCILDKSMIDAPRRGRGKRNKAAYRKNSLIHFLKDVQQK